MTDARSKEAALLEREKLRLERQRLALEIRLKRRELDGRRRKSWFELLANPLMLALVGGMITVIVTVVTNTLSAQANRESEEYRADLARQTAKQELQAELIKKFVEGGNTSTVRENLDFLVSAGLLPDYAGGIRKYLSENPNAAPAVTVAGGIIGTDDRVELSTQTPERRARFAGMGLLEISKRDGEFRCTGFLVAPKVVLTASFCVDSEVESAMFRPLEVASGEPAKSGQGLDLSTQARLEAKVGSNEAGVVLVALREPVRAAAMPLSRTPPQAGEKLAMAFYSGDTNKIMLSEHDTCTVASVDALVLRHLCDTGGGSTGAAMMNDRGEVVGIHLLNVAGGKIAWRADQIRSAARVRATFPDLSR